MNNVALIKVFDLHCNGCFSGKVLAIYRHVPERISESGRVS